MKQNIEAISEDNNTIGTSLRYNFNLVMIYHVCVYPFTHLSRHTPYGGSWDPNWGFIFVFELNPTGKDSVDLTQHEFQHHRRNPSLNTITRFRSEVFGLGKILNKGCKKIGTAVPAGLEKKDMIV